MAKQSISGRVAQLSRADLPALLARSDDPDALVDQLVADYTTTIAEAESTVAQTAASLRLLVQDQSEDAATARAWADRAERTARTASARRDAGDAAEAGRLDGLAGTARAEQAVSETEADTAQEAIVALESLVERLEAGLNSLRSTLDRLTGNREQFLAEALAATPDVPRTAGRVDLLDAEQSLAHFDALVGDEAR